MLSGKQKRFLRGGSTPSFTDLSSRENGVSEAMCKDIVDALEKRELLKVQVLQNCMDTPKDVAGELAEGTNAEVVQVIGKVIVLYKEATEKENRQIKLP